MELIYIWETYRDRHELILTGVFITTNNTVIYPIDALNITMSSLDEIYRKINMTVKEQEFAVFYAITDVQLYLTLNEHRGCINKLHNILQIM